MSRVREFCDRHVPTEYISDVTWRWRYKVSSLGRRRDKTVADFGDGTEIDENDNDHEREDAASPAADDTDGANKDDADGTVAPAKDPQDPKEKPKDTKFTVSKKKKKSSPPPKESTFGSSAVVSTLYEGINSTDRFIDWVDYPPRQLSKSAAKAADRVAIKVFKVKDHGKPVVSGRWQLKYHMVQVQNPLLVEALKELLEPEDEHLDAAETAQFKEPFRSLFFRYDDICARLRKTPNDSPLKPYLRLFLRLLDDVFGDIRARRRSLQAAGLVSFELAWTYFAKNSSVISWGQNCRLLSRVHDTVYRKKNPSTTVLVVNSRSLRFNGEAFVWDDLELEIPEFTGNKPITDLPAYPLEFNKDPAAVRREMSARGRMVLDYQGLTYCQYEGIGLLSEGKKISKHNVEGRILVDVPGYKKYHLALGSREGQDPYSQRNTVFGTGRAADDSGNAVYNYSESDDDSDDDDYDRRSFWSSSDRGGWSPVRRPKKSQRLTTSKRLGAAEQKKNKDAMLAREDELMFMSPLLEGYALKNKLWLTFYVEDIRPLVWNDAAFEHLVYEPEQKDLVLSFVGHHGTNTEQMQDVIVGKGQGLIILLSGPPGTGKTLTAEAVADRTHRPLFYLQAEDLGINAATLGANIKRVFDMANDWDAVILLDEADVFMAERAPHDIVRNELVSIFLRELEYFRGIIFLTTNLYQTIDSAFRSRVSLHLLFRPLTPSARLAIWRKFLERLPSTEAAGGLVKKRQRMGGGGGGVGGGGSGGAASNSRGRTLTKVESPVVDADLDNVANLAAAAVKTANPNGTAHGSVNGTALAPNTTSTSESVTAAGSASSTPKEVDSDSANGHAVTPASERVGKSAKAKGKERAVLQPFEPDQVAHAAAATAAATTTQPDAKKAERKATDACAVADAATPNCSAAAVNGSARVASPGLAKAGKGASSKPALLSDDDLKELALWQLNGREIKNAVKMVSSWCEQKNYKLTLSRMENGIRVTSPHASKTTGDDDAGDLYE